MTIGDAQLSCVHVESGFNCKLLCLSQVGGGAVAFTSSSVPGEVRPATTEPLPGLMPAFRVFAFRPRLSQNQMCTGTHCTHFHYLHYLHKLPLSRWIFAEFGRVGSFSVCPCKLWMPYQVWVHFSKKAAMCSWLIQRGGFVSYQRSACKQHFLIGSLFLNKGALQTAAGWDLYSVSKQDFFSPLCRKKKSPLNHL